MNHTKIIIIITFLTITAACKKNNADRYEGLDYKEVCEKFDQLAFEQRDLLNQIRNKYGSDKHFIAQFNQEQISWIQYQENRLRSLYSQDWDRYYRKNYGVPTFNGCKCKELIRLSEIRNDDLRVYLNGPTAAQEECPVQGSL